MRSERRIFLRSPQECDGCEVKPRTKRYENSKFGESSVLQMQ